jgi:hypothetical protein
MLHPESGGGDRELAPWRETAAMGDRKEGDAMEVHLADARLLAERKAGSDVPGLVSAKAYGGTCKE